MSSGISAKELFGETTLAWGKKYPSERLADIWGKDKSYLLWACGLTGSGSKMPDVPPPSFQRKLVELALELERGNQTQVLERLNSLRNWQRLAQEGVGLSDLPRPTTAQCQEAISQATVLAGHSDLDGLLSLAIAIAFGGALGGASKAIPGQIRILNYVYRNLNDFTNALALQGSDKAIIIDFAAHPRAAMTFDHHATCLSFWEEGTEIPKGIYDTSMPSCPRLLATYAGYPVPEPVLTGSDRVDGAIYSSPQETTNLDDPFVLFEYLLGVDVSDNLKRALVIELARTKLDVSAVLARPIWQARRNLLAHELEDQRSFWNDEKRIVRLTGRVAIVDGREAPYHPAKFRYLPFETTSICERAYLITIRPGRSATTINLGLSRNPFHPETRTTSTANLGAIAKMLGQGGGRPEAASTTLPLSQLDAALSQILPMLDVA